MPERRTRLAVGGRVALALRVWASYALVRAGMRRRPLPVAVSRLGRAGRGRARRHSPERLAWVVHRCLRVGGFRATCMTKSLVLFRLLRRQGDDAEVVIGLPRRPTDPTAHAWVEIDGVDVGPPPGRADHAPMARFK